MEFLKQLITRILGSGLLSTALVLVRAVTVLMVLYVIWRCYTSFKKGQRRKDRHAGGCRHRRAFPRFVLGKFHWAQPQLRYSNTR